jgi:hypothetical protein
MINAQSKPPKMVYWFLKINSIIYRGAINRCRKVTIFLHGTKFIFLQCKIGEMGCFGRVKRYGGKVFRY